MVEVIFRWKMIAFSLEFYRQESTIEILMSMRRGHVDRQA